MKDEIKEILEKLKDREETYQFCKQYKLAINDWTYEAHYLLDYITNLQTIEQQYSAILSENAELENKITNLQEENKEWSMIFDTFSKRPYAHKYLEEKKKELGNNKIIGLDSEMIYKDYYDYKSRNKKAIEYILKLDKDYDINVYQEDKHWAMVLYILQGEDKDE